MVWTSALRMRGGWLWDSPPDSWYEQFANRPKATGITEEFFTAPRNGGTVDRSCLGFRYVRNDQWWPRAQLSVGYPTAQSQAVYVPLWLMVMATGVLPGSAVARRMRAHGRRRRGLCVNCGYDLRGTPQSCPECGVQAGSNAKAPR